MQAMHPLQDVLLPLPLSVPCPEKVASRPTQVESQTQKKHLLFAPVLLLSMGLWAMHLQGTTHFPPRRLELLLEEHTQAVQWQTPALLQQQAHCTPPRTPIQAMLLLPRELHSVRHQ